MLSDALEFLGLSVGGAMAVGWAMATYFDVPLFQGVSIGAVVVTILWIAAIVRSCFFGRKA